MAYPQAPWTLQGYAVGTVHLIDIDKVRPFIPKELEIISFWPGKTLGGVYLSYYAPGSVLEYNELIVAPAMVSYAGKVGGWVSHIYVDNPDSVAGGREIWGLPKELASFSWDKSSSSQHSCTVSQNDKLLCNLHYSNQSLALQIPVSGNSFGRRNSELLYFQAGFKSRLGLVSGRLEVPAQSDFAALNLGQPLSTVYINEMHLKVEAPTVIGQVSELGRERLTV